MATYSVTTTARQDAALAYLATKRGVTVQALMDAELARVLARLRNEFEQDDGVRVSAAYLAAAPAVQNQIKTALGLP